MLLLFDGIFMIYNTLGKTGLKVSRLGFGTMRLPTINSNEDIDEVEANKMFEYAVENGVNLFSNLDTVRIVLDVLEEITNKVSTIDAK